MYAGLFLAGSLLAFMSARSYSVPTSTHWTSSSPHASSIPICYWAFEISLTTLVAIPKSLASYIKPQVPEGHLRPVNILWTLPVQWEVLPFGSISDGFDSINPWKSMGFGSICTVQSLRTLLLWNLESKAKILVILVLASAILKGWIVLMF